MIIDNHPFSVNEKGHLEIGNVDTVELANEYGTPLYVYDVAKVRKNCRAFIDTFTKLGVKAQVTYASKAFSTIAILEVINQEGLSLDVVSEGELYTALKADFPTEKIHLHGNNKSEAELIMAIDNNIGCIIIDNFYEIELLDRLLKEKNKQMDVLFRVTPGVESETHQYIMTGNEDSKFGFNLQNGQIEHAYHMVQGHPNIKLKGLHCHIGSQIFTTKSFTLAIEMLFTLIAKWNQTDNFIPEVMNFGGGFGIRYTKDDRPLPQAEHVEKIVETVESEITKLSIPMPEIWIEPGRSIVGDAGITLYTVGSMKSIPNVREYVAIDGGMADNIRPALYQAKYEGIIANKADKAPTKTVSIAGKCCESGDMLIWDLPVASIEHNDILAVFSTGAYGYAMASNYNRFQKPAVVFVEDGTAQLVVKRETLDDIIKNDVSYTKNSNLTGR
ncbi:diaminopimelate decarboxylase [Pseudogracilibacillus auburnensis]|uniref:diaminopimelate decarboxylase n=1 Tax=Pseudogracilibacillus auburnensis TaxID=1494959 RepID=UPI001A9589CF|nr:diaminopimelate decarboxylase [Pseudogracilibacillus auburnensis]MBO1003094.1 diaminopimelate decarboxylase [Pseudogracilibacillus auburnensis]